MTVPATSAKVTPSRVIDARTSAPSRSMVMSASFFGSPFRSREMAMAFSRSMGISSGRTAHARGADGVPVGDGLVRETT